VNLPRLGVIGFLGILFPGSILTLNIIFIYLIASNKLTTLNDILTSGSTLPWVIVFFIVSYLAGIIVRMLPTWFAECTFCTKKSNDCKNEQCFYGLCHKLVTDPNSKVIFPFSNLKKLTNTKKNYDGFNYLKSYIIQYSPSLAEEVKSAEAFSRSISGSFWSIYISLLLTIAVFFYYGVLISIILTFVTALFISVGSENNMKFLNNTSKYMAKFMMFVIIAISSVPLISLIPLILPNPSISFLLLHFKKDFLENRTKHYCTDLKVVFILMFFYAVLLFLILIKFYSGSRIREVGVVASAYSIIRRDQDRKK